MIVSTIERPFSLRVGPDSAGVLMTPEEFDAIEDYDELYHYELVHGVLVVTPFASEAETKPNEILGHLLLTYQETHPRGATLDETFCEYWIIDRFKRVMTVYFDQAGKPGERRVGEDQVYATDLLPGFEVPLARLLAAADKWK